MPDKGQIITNPVNGDRYEYLETAKDTGGERVTMKVMLQTKGQLVPDHYHVYQEETFEILSGTLTVLINGKTTKLAAGEKRTLPKNKPHNHYNNEDLPVSYIHTVTPALDFDYLIENLVGLAADGKQKNGKFGLMQELVTLKYLDSKTFLAGIPYGIQVVLMNVLAPIGRWMGYRAIYK